MKRTITAAIAALVLLPLSVHAQSSPPEQTINIEEAERISVEKTGPSVVPVSLTQLESVGNLINIRDDFTELTVREAEGL